MKKHFFIIALLVSLITQGQKVKVYGQVKDAETNSPIPGVSIITENSTTWATSKNNGNFSLEMYKTEQIQLTFKHLAYETLCKIVKFKNSDSVFISIYLKQKSNILPGVEVTSVHKPETLVGNPKFSIYDFSFYEDKFILLTAENSLSKAELKLTTENGKILDSYQIPKSAGKPKHFFKDYEGYTDLVCEDTVLRIDVVNTNFYIGAISQASFKNYYALISDSINNFIYHSNYWAQYPTFSYFNLKNNDSVSNLLKTITNEDLLKLYNIELRYLPTRAKLECRRIAEQNKVDQHIVAAMMSGFTSSMFYEPLYAPLFILNDTVGIFNHHTDYLYHYTKSNKLIDSVKINYHHPKNWREWKKQLFVDEVQSKVYAFFSNADHHYLKQINFTTGKEEFTYKLKHPSAQKIKLKDGYIYYVYRPFESTQEKFLYRERVE